MGHCTALERTWIQASDQEQQLKMQILLMNGSKHCKECAAITKIAVVADIHANIYALTAFLDYLAMRDDISHIWNVGDFLQIGPHPSEVADVVLSDPRFLNILGNNEQALLYRDPSAFGPDELAHQDWVTEQVGPLVLDQLSQLPSSRLIQANGLIVALVHRPEDAEDLRADSIFVGHTHRQGENRCGSTLVVNPGSLGASFAGPVAEFCIAELGPEGPTISFVNLPYDGTRLIADYTKRNVPDAQTFFRLFSWMRR